MINWPFCCFFVCFFWSAALLQFPEAAHSSLLTDVLILYYTVEPGCHRCQHPPSFHCTVVTFFLSFNIRLNTQHQSQRRISYGTQEMRCLRGSVHVTWRMILLLFTAPSAYNMQQIILIWSRAGLKSKVWHQEKNSNSHFFGLRKKTYIPVHNSTTQHNSKAENITALVRVKPERACIYSTTLPRRRLDALSLNLGSIC